MILRPRCGSQAEVDAHVARHDDDGADRGGEDVADILDRLGRFNHRDGEQLPVRIERPDVGLRVIFSGVGDAPQSGGPPGTPAPLAARLGLRRAPHGRVAHGADEPHGLLPGVDVRQEYAERAEVQHLLHGPLEVFVAVLRNAHERGEPHAAAGVAVVVHLGQDPLQPIARERRVLHVDEAPVPVGDGGLAVLQRVDHLVQPRPLLRLALAGEDVPADHHAGDDQERDQV